jgi:hypothetical protein
MNWNLVGSIYGRSSLKVHILLWSITKHDPPQAILVSDWPIFKNLLLWNHFAKLTETWQEASMECRLLISSLSVNKHGHHRQFLFMIGRYLKNLLLWNCLAKWTETWWKASTCMEGCVLSFLKAEWKVSNTGSVHWASSSYHTAPNVALYCIILLPMWPFIVSYCSRCRSLLYHTAPHVDFYRIILLPM